MTDLIEHSRRYRKEAKPRSGRRARSECCAHHDELRQGQPPHGPPVGLFGRDLRLRRFRPEACRIRGRGANHSRLGRNGLPAREVLKPAVRTDKAVNREIDGETTSGIRTDYLVDALGSVTATVSQSTQVQNTSRYKPYEPSSPKQAPPPTPNPSGSAPSATAARAGLKATTTSGPGTTGRPRASGRRLTHCGLRNRPSIMPAPIRRAWRTRPAAMYMKTCRTPSIIGLRGASTLMMRHGRLRRSWTA